MSSEHPQFEPWGKEKGFPFPVGDIDLHYADEDRASATVIFTLPPAQPFNQTFAERSIGIAPVWQLWFALECSTNAAGAVVCEAVLRSRHLHAFAEHKETQMGVMQEVRLTAANLKGGSWAEAIDNHEQHSDHLFVTYGGAGPGKVTCTIFAVHQRMNRTEFFEYRERLHREIPKWMQFDYFPKLPLEPRDYENWPQPPPKPTPMPDKPNKDGT